MASLISKILQKLLMIKGEKNTFADKETFEKLCEDSKKKNSVPYSLNYDKFSVDIERKELNGTVYFVLNSKSKTSKNKVFYLHGGGYLIEITPQHWKMIDTIAKMSGTEIWVPIYPLIPNYNAEQSYSAVTKIYKKFCSKSNDEKIIIMGDSAGGGFALGIAQYAKKNNLTMPDSLVLISPWVDASMTNPDIEKISPFDPTLDAYGVKKCGEMWADGKNIKDPIVSPLFGNLVLGCDISIFTGTNDIINVDAHSLYNALKLNNQKVTLYEEKGQPHVYVMWPIPEAKKGIKTIVNLIK